MQKILFLSGAHAVGKTELAKAISVDYQIFDLGPMIREFYKQNITDKSFYEWNFESSLKDVNFAGKIFVSEIQKKLKTEPKNILIVGARSKQDIVYIQNFFRLPSISVFLEAEDTISKFRYETREGISLTDVEWNALKLKDKQIGLDSVREMSEFIILNDSTVQDLVRKFNEIIRTKLTKLIALNTGKSTDVEFNNLALATPRSSYELSAVTFQIAESKTEVKSEAREDDEINVKNFVFTTATGKEFIFPFITPLDVSVREDISDSLVLTDESQRDVVLQQTLLQKSKLNIGGSGLVFGTFDNLHIGHKIMINTLFSVADKIFVGIEDRNVALSRKASKHPILSNEERLKEILTTFSGKNCIPFIRQKALDDIKRLESEGEKLSTLLLSCTQLENPEIAEVIDYCVNSGIQILLVDRNKVINCVKEISSSFIHKIGAAKTDDLGKTK